MREFGVEVQASLELTSTTLDLSQRLTPTSGSGSSSGSSSGSRAGSGAGSATGSGSSSGTGTRSSQGAGAGPGAGPNPRSNPGSGSGSNPGSSGTTGGAGQPTNNPAQSKPATQSAGVLPWIYGIMGIVAAAVISSSVWIARSRMKNTSSKITTARSSI
jgi:hypothetical protein